MSWLQMSWPYVTFWLALAALWWLATSLTAAGLLWWFVTRPLHRLTAELTCGEVEAVIEPRPGRNGGALP